MGRGLIVALLSSACGPTVARDTGDGSDAGTAGSTTSQSSVTATHGSAGSSASTGSITTTAGDSFEGAGEWDSGGIQDLGVGPPVNCPLDWGETSQVAGGSWLGESAWPYAWYSFVVAESGAMAPFVHFASSLDTGQACIEGNCGSYLTATIELPEPWLGSGPSMLMVWDSDYGGDGNGTITVTEIDGLPESPDPADWPRVVGSLDATDDPWSLHGEFVAPWCEALVKYVGP